MTLTESATRSSAASHCLMSSAVTHTGKLPKKTVKLIQFAALTPWMGFLLADKRRDPFSASLILSDRFTWCNVTATTAVRLRFFDPLGIGFIQFAGGLS